MDNSLAQMRPHLISEWSERNMPLTADEITYGSKKIYWWKGSCGHEWQASAKARSQGEGCPVCSGARVVKGVNDLGTLRPELAAEWAEKNLPLEPSMVTTGSRKEVYWKGKCGHEWKAAVKRRSQGTGCPYCSHNKVLPGFNDLESRFPEVAAEWSDKNLPLRPDMVTAFRNQKVWWQCSRGHEWNTLISTRTGGSKCPFCTGISLLRGFNDFATRQPALAEEWSDRNLPLTPDSVNEKSTKNVWWKCRTCGNEWKALVKSRVKGSACPVCAEREVLPGYNDLATTDPRCLSEWDYERNIVFTPETVSRNSMKVVWWKAQCGHFWRAKISDRTIEGKGCPVCEEAFRAALLRLIVIYYTGQTGLEAVIDSDGIIGLVLEIYVPELRLAIETAGITITERKEQLVKAHVCKCNGISYITVARSDNDVSIAQRVKGIFQKKHIYITSDTEMDLSIVRKQFDLWIQKRNRR